MGTLKLNTIQQFRRDNAAVWAEKNPVLLEGEPGLELDTGKIKIGDGVSAWNALLYFSVDSESKADVDLSNVKDDVFLAKANQAGIGGGSVSSVNGVEQVEGNITLTAADIPYSDGESIQQAVSKILSGETDIPSAYFSITVENPDLGGIITVDKTRAKMNEQITVTVIPETGYALDTKTLKQNDTVIVDNKFIMPNCNVIIKGVFDDNNLIYTLSEDGTYYSVKQKSNTSPTSQIQRYRDGKPIKVIEPSGFYKNTTIRSIDLPDTIEEIGASAFEGCSNLVSVRWSTNLKVIETKAFCSTPIDSFILPDGVTTIKMDALKANAYIFEYRIPKSVINIQTPIFWANTAAKIDNLYIDAENIPTGLVNTTTINRLHIGTNVKRICESAFQMRSLPAQITIEEGLEEIETEAFYYTYDTRRMDEFVIPASVQKIASQGFYNYAKKYIIKGKSSIPSTWAADWYYDSSSTKPIIEFQP